MRKFSSTAIGIFCVLAFLGPATVSQVQPVYDRGIMGLAQVLKQLNTSASAMMIGAHPDDEDTALLAYLARGENARTAYLSLTRGDGGQNIIGPQLGEALGVIRTEELLQARRLDGAEQFFTRAYDYGFSKTLAEAQSKWPEDIILCDAVKAIREFKPLIVVSQFSGTPTDGHGQHQYAGWIAPRAVQAAADRTKCTGNGEPWKVRRFFVRHGFRATGEPQMRVNTGKFDPILGRSYFEIAMEARSQHKSQEQGVLELKGPMFSGLNRTDGLPPTKDIFEGIDIGILGIADHTDNTEETFGIRLKDVSEIAKRAYSEFDPREPAKIVPLLVAGYKAAYDAEWSTRYPNSKALMRFKQDEFVNAIEIAAGIQIDALAESETVVPGEAVGVGVKVFSPLETLKVADVELYAPLAPERWSITSEEIPKTNSPAFVQREVPSVARYYRVTPSVDVWPTQPYWLIEPRDGEVFLWKGLADDETMPFQNVPLRARIKLELFGSEVVIERDVQYRYADDIRGEVRRNLSVVPRVSIEPDQPLILVTTSGKAQTKDISFTLTNYSNRSATGKTSISLDSKSADWTSPGAPDSTLQRKGEKTKFTRSIRIPANVRPGRYTISGDVLIDGKYYGMTMNAPEYPHIQTQRFYKPANVDFQVLELETAPVKVGYIMGSGDKLPTALEQIGIKPELLSDADIASSDLSRFDTIVVGIRAYQVRPALVANNKRLMDFMSAGGTLVVQYQLSAYAQQNLAPYPAQQGPRTVDENAAVNIVMPDHPLTNFPNKIGPSDFEGWVQERNLYNFATMDERYTGILETHDSGEAENRGGLVVADVGKGKYVYCSYSLFRQLPAGVPGAYRLLANMVSLPKAK